jgi:protein gp37
MGKNSKIEWCDHTFNPWFGCQKVSAGCDHCYAEALMDTRLGNVKWGPHGERVRTSPAYWRQPIRWNQYAQSSNSRARVFCASLSDWLDNKVPSSWRDDLAQVIVATPHLDWLLLTKRLENFPKLAPWPEAPANVWIGATTEDQPNYDRRIKKLRSIATAVHWISYEPGLGPLTLGDSPPDWVICGGESGKRARWMDPQWARDLRDECAAKQVAFFFKQMTSKAEIPTDLLVRQFPSLGKDDRGSSDDSGQTTTGIGGETEKPGRPATRHI